MFDVKFIHKIIRGHIVHGILIISTRIILMKRLQESLVRTNLTIQRMFEKFNFYTFT